MPQDQPNGHFRPGHSSGCLPRTCTTLQPSKSSSISSDTRARPELSGKREVTDLILQASSAGTFREFSSPVPTHRAPNVPGDLAQAARLQLLFINCFGCFRARVWHHSLPRQSHHLHSPLNQRCPVTRLSRRVCEAMAQRAQILPKASTAQCERQNHHFTWWYLAIIKSHIQGLCFHPACHRQLSSSARCCL